MIGGIRVIGVISTVCALASGLAAAPRTPGDAVATAIASPKAFAAALAPDVAIGAVAFDDATCRKRFHVPSVLAEADRAAFAACVVAAATRVWVGWSKTTATLGTKTDVVLGIEVREGKIVAVGAVAPDATDAALPTVLRRDTAFTPTDRAKAALTRADVHFADATMKLCIDVKGAVTSRRLIQSSGVRDFDDEVTAYFARVTRLSSVTSGGGSIAACAIVRVQYPADVYAPLPDAPVRVDP